MGKLRERMSFSRIDEVLEMPNLIEVQKNSYQRFLDTDLREVLADVSPITDYNGKLVLEFVDYSLDEPKNSIARCRERDITYAAPLKVFVRLKNKETGEIKESDVFMGDFPLMTDHGTFIINGAERVIVSQLVRSPGVYFDVALDKAGKKLYSSQIIPNRGAWLEYETDSNDIFYVRVDRIGKVPITVLVRALGYGTNQEILDLIQLDPSAAAQERMGGRQTTAWRIEAVLREFPAIEPINCWFRFPIHIPDAEGLLDESSVAGSRESNLTKSSKRVPVENRKESFNRAYAELSEEGRPVKIDDMAKKMGVSKQTVRNRYKDVEDEYWLDSNMIGKLIKSA